MIKTRLGYIRAAMKEARACERHLRVAHLYEQDAKLTGNPVSWLARIHRDLAAAASLLAFTFAGIAARIPVNVRRRSPRHGS